MSGSEAISMTVQGTPRPEPRPRARVVRAKGGKSFARIYAPRRGSPEFVHAEQWRQAIALVASRHRPEQPMIGPLGVDLTFRFRRPDSHYGTGRNRDVLKRTSPEWHVQKPDADNLLKLVLDVLKCVAFFGDDAQVVDVTVTKGWVQTESQATIVVAPLDDLSEKHDELIDHQTGEQLARSCGSFEDDGQ